MPDYDYLRNYELKERNIITKNRADLCQKGCIQKVSDIYPELPFSDSLIYLRSNIPLKLVLLLYDKVIIYIPPATKEYIEKKFDIRYEDLLILCRKGLVIPIIAHPTDYIDLHFQELLELNPPSVWARGISLVNVFDMDFEEAKRVLPLQRIASFASVRKQWRWHYPNANDEQLTDNIIRELSTLYADLIVFGYRDVIENLLDYQIPEYQIVYYLKTLNELLTYPSLFGMGGTPVFDYKNTKLMFRNVLPLDSKKIKSKMQIVYPNLKYILEDFDIFYNDLTVRQIIEYHRDDYCIKLRSAIQNLETDSNYMLQDGKIDLNNICKNAEKVKKSMDDFRRRINADIVKSLNAIESEVKNSIILGGISLGNFLVDNNSNGVIDIVRMEELNVNGVCDLLPNELQKMISSKIIAEKFSPSVAALWDVHNKLS